MPITVPSVSKEFIRASLASDVILDTQTIEVAFLPASATPTAETSWLEASWIGEPAMTRFWRILIGPDTSAPLAVGTYSVWSRCTDATEQPVRKHDTLTIT